MTSPMDNLSHDSRVKLLTSAGEHMLHERAWSNYTGNNIGDSAEMFQQLVDLAGRRGNVEEETDLRFWLGTALHGSGHLLQAAAAMAPTLDQANFVGGRVLQNRLLTRYLLVAVDIPLPLARLDAAFGQAEKLIRHWGWQDQESRLPYAKGCLALYRGHRKDALRWAHLALSRNWNDPSHYAGHTYLMLLLKACAANGRPDRLQEVMAQGHSFDAGSFRTTRRMVINLVNAEISLEEGDMDQALELTRLAEEAANVTRDHTYSFIGHVWRVRMLLRAGLTREARPVLAKLLRRRHVETGHDRFELRMLLGEFHLAEVERLRAAGSTARVREKDHLDAAEGVFGAARRIGLVVDSRLKCHGKRDRANGKLKEVGEVRG